MKCQNLGAVCLLWSFVMTSLVEGRSTDAPSRLIAPVIIEGPKFHEIFRAENDRKELPCTATGTPPIEYRWFLNGTELIPGDHTRLSEGRLVVNNPPLHMQGFYQCQASNSAGISMSNITYFQAAVFVASVPPRERTMTGQLNVAELDHVILHCSHIGTSIPRPQVWWESSTDGEVTFLRVKLDNRITQSENGSLVFSFIRKSDSAVYKCIAYNSILLKSLGGRKYRLHIDSKNTPVIERKLNEAPVLLVASSDTTILEEENLTLQCLFGAWPIHEVEWTTPSGETFVNHSWTIRNASAADAGIYSCRARKMAGVHSRTISISIKVDAIPVFTKTPSNAEVFRGESATFVCEGHGRPFPTVTWYANGTSLDKVHDTLDHFTSDEGSMSTLVLRNLQTTSTVTCNISNVYGYRLHSAFVAFVLENKDGEPLQQSSQDDGLSSRKTSSYFSPLPSPYQRSTRPQLLSSRGKPTNTMPKDVSENNNYENKYQPYKPVTEGPNPSSGLARTTLIVTILVVVVVLCVVVGAIIIIYIRIRQARKPASSTRQEVARFRNHQVYDSDDSGFDDLKAENSERRNLQQDQADS